MIESDTKQYYSKLSAEYIENNSTSAYVLFATGELLQETDRAKYLWGSNSTAIEIISRICELELIEKHKDKLQEEFERMLQSEKINDLNILFKLLGKNEGTTLALQLCLKQLIIKDFDKIYNPTCQSCQEIVTQVICIYQKYVKFINDAFNNEQIMRDTLQESLSIIINQKIKKSWLLFSAFIDDLLRKKIAIDNIDYEIVKLFANLTERFDDFVTDYKEKLAQRIIFNAVDISSEESIFNIFNSVEKFTAEQNCHLNRMLQDFKEKPDDSILVLTSHSWPTSSNPIACDTKTLPAPLTQLMEAFEEEYCEIHCGRRLQWCPHLMTVELKNGTIMTLLQYQIISSLPISINLPELAKTLGRHEGELSVSIKSLQDAGIVLLNPATGTFEFSVLPDNLNLIPLGDAALAALEEVESIAGKDSIVTVATSMEIDESRQLRQSFIIQSLVTMIIKRQRQASPAELKKLLCSAAGALKQGHSFLPQAEEIDSAINGLISKGYLEFNEQEHLYIYIP